MIPLLEGSLYLVLSVRFKKNINLSVLSCSLPPCPHLLTPCVFSVVRTAFGCTNAYRILPLK
jgi:hypothetical protein